jgi:uncharacterized protein YndB with AHSA1/START domain
MASAQVLPDSDTVVAEIFVAAPPARVFEAIIDPKQTAQWWGQKGRYHLTEASSDFRVGGKWRSAGVSEDGKPFHVEGEYLEIEPPRLVAYTWNPSYYDLPTTIVRWELEPRPIHLLQHSGPNRVGTGTVVKIRHSGFGGNLESAKSHGEGWKRILGWMQAFVEKGETHETRSA